jgi:hypothetical protein
MRRRLAVALAALGAAAAIGGAGIYGNSGSSRPAAGACRDWLAAPAYRRQIAGVRGRAHGGRQVRPAARDR